ncbi:MFS transporter, partial [Acinetobacter baumannii]
RSRANTFLILGNPVTILWMSVVSGYLVEHFSWRWMFIIEGLPAVIWAFIWWRLVDDRPRQAAWLSGSEKRDLEDALAAEQAKLEAILQASDGHNLERQLEVAADALRLPPWDAKVEHLSGGEKRRVALCRLLLSAPD